MIVTNKNFRPGTDTEVKEYIFNMMMPGAKTAALGDMIAWMPAIIYVAENYNYVRGHLIVPQYFVAVAQNLMQAYPHWRVHVKIPDRLAQGGLMKQPLAHPINATGMHLVDLGFLYFLGIVPPPEGAALYPVLDLEDVPMVAPVPAGQRYVVMTPGATAATRMMLPSAFNEVSSYLDSKDILPVYLGNTDMVGRNIMVDGRYDLSMGLNMLGKTSLLEAAKIMQGAHAVIGIDNGLLHLAGCTDAPIIFGFTMTGPTQRRINRPHGHTVELYADKEKLQCLFCQEHIRFFTDHHFTNCIYKENEPACVKALNAETWIQNLETLLAAYDTPPTPEIEDAHPLGAL